MNSVVGAYVAVGRSVELQGNGDTFSAILLGYSSVIAVLKAGTVDPVVKSPHRSSFMRLGHGRNV
tara:strand:- start:5494 stop:5688 length:195 start_codon:yes stop_codon:yes gene_type:complete